MTLSEIKADPDVDGVSAELHERLYEFNAAATGHRDGARLALTVRAADGELLAGLTGWTWGGCGYVDVLWVRDDHRGGGLGSALLAEAERVAGHVGCTQMVLETHDFQAPWFYERRGYRIVGSVDGYPRGHAQHVLVKALEVP